METFSLIKKKKITLFLTVFFSFFSVSQVHAQANPWAAFNNIEIPNTLPDGSLEKREFSDTLFYQISDFYVDLSSVMLDLKARSQEPTMTVIIADTVEISNSFILNLENQSLFIFARQIVGQGSGTVMFNVNENKNGGIGIFTDDLSAQINVAGLFPGFNFDVKAMNTSSAQVGEYIIPSPDADQLVVSSISLAGLMDLAPALLGEHLEKTFDVGATIYDQAPALSRSMLNWNEAALRALPTFRADDIFLENLYLQTANLKQFFDLAQVGTNYVPKLSSDLYQDTYLAYLDAMEAYRVQYDRFVDRNLDISARVESANLMQAYLSDAVAAESATMERSEQQINSLRENMSNLRIQFRDQKLLTNTARVEFQIGIDAYKQQQRIDLAVSVLETVTSAGTAIASGDPSALAEFAASIPSTALELQSIQDKIDGIADILERVQTMAQNMDELSSKADGGVNQHDIASALETFELTVPSLEQANDVWEVFLVEVKQELQLAIDEGIGGASNFLIALETLIIYGKSITATEVSLIQEMSRLIDLRITAEVNRRHLERMVDLIAQLDTQGVETTELASIFYRSLNALKRPMFVAISKFAAAFNYWGLTTSTVTPSLNKTYEQYRLDLALIQEQYNAILTNFDAAPQNYNITNLLITEDALLEDFKSDGEFSFTIGLSHPDFIHFDRVRLNRVRVILQGEALEEDQSYYFDIKSNGEYRDRLGEQHFTFNADPFLRLFAYELLDSQNEEYNFIVDSSIVEDLKFAYFEPTPFTTWSIQLRDAEYFDLDQVESIKLEFMGNAIPRFN